MSSHPQLPTANTPPDDVRQFIATHEYKLLQPIARNLPGLTPQDAEALKVLRSDPTHQPERHPRAPRKLGELGGFSMRILRRLSPGRATAIEQIHAEKLEAYSTAAAQHAIAYQESQAQRERAIAAWREHEQAIRNDLLTMARLCRAVVAEEERQIAEEARRAAEAERRRQEAEQRRRAQQASAAARAQQVREKHYHTTKAQYLQGLPQGKAKDDVTIAVSNLAITIKHGGIVGSWEYSIPIASLADASIETVKHLLSSEKRLRLIYVNERGVATQATFANLRVDEMVKQIAKARAGK